MLRSDANPDPKRGSLSTAFLHATEAMDFVSAHYFSFTTQALAESMGISDTSARRMLLTFETVGWVERVDGKLSPAHASNGANPTQHFRALKRIRRI
jgi:DNA-binding IclR family transcriptional regulator